MRIITNAMTPSILFWYAIYGTLLVLLFAVGVVAGNQNSNKIAQ
jgi:hypothetical protein